VFNDYRDVPGFGFGLPSVRVGATSSPQRLEWNSDGNLAVQLPHSGTGQIALSLVLTAKGQSELLTRKGESGESSGSSEEEKKAKVPKIGVDAGAKAAVEVEKPSGFKVEFSADVLFTSNFVEAGPASFCIKNPRAG
jgi:hypothetical protein